MSGFIEGENRYQSTLFPERIDDYIDEDMQSELLMSSFYSLNRTNKSH